MAFRVLKSIARFCVVAALWGGNLPVYAAGLDVIAELHELPVPPDQPIDLSGPPLSGAHLNPDYSLDAFGREEITVFGRRLEPWRIGRDREIANYARAYSTFGPTTQNYNVKIERALTIEIGHLTINSKGIFLWY